MGAFMLLASLAVSSCTEKSDWDIDSSYSRPFGTDENGISVETDSKVARAVVTWSSTSNTDYYIIEISPNEMTDETPMGSEENGNIVYGNDPANRIKQSPYTLDNLAVNTTYYMRIKSISGEKESRWVNYKKTFASVKAEAILNIPTTEDLPEGQGKVRMSWEAGLAVDHFEIMETGATEATTRVISSTEAAAGEAWVENLKSFTEYTITIYNGNSPRGSQTVTIPGLEIESTISDITANSVVFSWEETVDVDEYACVLSTEGVPESGTKLMPADIAAHKVTITGLASSTEYTAYAFANGSICSRITFTTKKGKPTGYTEMTWEDAQTNWNNLSGDILITFSDGEEATSSLVNIPATVTNLIFWGEGNQSTFKTNNLQPQGNLERLEFYNLKISLNSSSNNPFIYQNNANGYVKNIDMTSCTIEGFRGVVRIRSSVSIDLKVTIDDCIIDKTGSVNESNNNYGILQTSEVSTLLSSVTLNMTNSTFARPKGSNSIFICPKTGQTNFAATISNCTFYGMRPGDSLVRYLYAQASNSFIVTNTLFAEGGVQIHYDNNPTISATETWTNVYRASDFTLSRESGLKCTPLELSSSQLFPNGKVDIANALDLIYGNEVSNEYKAIGDPRWNK